MRIEWSLFDYYLSTITAAFQRTSSANVQKAHFRV